MVGYFALTEILHVTALGNVSVGDMIMFHDCEMVESTANGLKSARLGLLRLL
ncbi:hypothetical protein [Hydrogenovibrio sp. JE_KL2]|uniref:hypothetical protein n=1 Tax=Hydrogenovibrio sp. JE_KL2 TaxID=2651188 RepID=UPI00156218AB|nr:hypothetical protein [Hydrogenovibrio sp. JE_KL2]